MTLTTTSDWPDYAHIVRDGMRIAWRAPISRIRFEDGMVRQAMHGTSATRLITFDVLVDDADRERFNAFVAALGGDSSVRISLPPENVLIVHRIAGGRGGIRWRVASVDGKRWWRGTLTLERVDTFIRMPAVMDQRWPIGVARTFQLPAAPGAIGAVRYTLTPQPPAGMAWNPVTRAISGTPAELITAPRSYTYRAVDELIRIAEVVFSISTVTLWRSILDRQLSSRLYADDREPPLPLAWTVDGLPMIPKSLFVGRTQIFTLEPARNEQSAISRLTPSVERQLRARIRDTASDKEAIIPVIPKIDNPGWRVERRLAGQWQGRYFMILVPGGDASSFGALVGTAGPWTVEFFLSG